MICLGGRAGGSGRKLVQYNGGYDTPFPFPQIKADANEIARFNFRMGKYADVPPIDGSSLPIQTVRLDQLSNSQDNLNKAAMDNLLKMSTAQIRGITDSTTTADLPLVIKYNNTYQIQDGHHRLSALWVKKAKTAKVRILDLNKL